MDKKLCKECKVEKDISEYYKHSEGKNKTYYQSTCKKCYIKYNTIKNWEKYNIKIKYYEYEEMYLKCKGKCYICKDEHKTLDVDHCHISGDIRGLLCGKCNKGLGLLGDTKESIEEALKYFN